MATLVSFGREILIELPISTSIILLIKLAAFILHIKTKSMRHVARRRLPYNISNRQLSGLQYLSGCVSHNLHEELKNCTKWNVSMASQFWKLVEKLLLPRKLTKNY